VCVCVCVCSVWHYVVQGTFGVGLVVLLIALKTASFHVCCCHCCRDSYVIATIIGSKIMIGRESPRSTTHRPARLNWPTDQLTDHNVRR